MKYSPCALDIQGCDLLSAAHYEKNVVWTATMLSMLATGGAAKLPGDPGVAIPNAGAGRGALAGMLGDTEGLEAPKAFLNFFLFDGLFNQVDAGFTQVSKAAAITPADPKSKHEKLVMEVEVQQAGYLFTNLSFDGDENVEVYFDNFTVIHEHGNIVQVQDYYPYGMPFNTKMAEHEVLNRYLYQGKELQDSTGWYDFHARQYDAALGSFWEWILKVDQCPTTLPTPP